MRGVGTFMVAAMKKTVAELEDIKSDPVKLKAAADYHNIAVPMAAQIIHDELQGSYRRA